MCQASQSYTKQNATYKTEQRRMSGEIRVTLSICRMEQRGVTNLKVPSRMARKERRKPREKILSLLPSRSQHCQKRHLGQKGGHAVPCAGFPAHAA
ncbi:unnamed protein product [Prunus brigantina]